MRRLEATDLLVLWERGEALHPVDRALLALQLAEPERGRDELARLPLGERDALLLELRGATLGDRVGAVTRCPRCDGTVELDLRCGALAAASEPVPDEWTIEHGGTRLTLRALDSLDAAAAATAGRAGGTGAARGVLLERAVVSAERDGREVPASELEPDAVAAAAASIAERDPRAELLLDLSCPGCGHGWQAVLDVAGFVWRELAARAERVFTDVDVLARAYGWREPDVLALSESRRAAYLALATG